LDVIFFQIRIQEFFEGFFNMARAFFPLFGYFRYFPLSLGKVTRIMMEILPQM